MNFMEESVVLAAIKNRTNSYTKKSVDDRIARNNEFDSCDMHLRWRTDESMICENSSDIKS